MADYATERANFIAQARQREAQNRVQQIQAEHAQTVAELDQAVAEGDMTTAHYRALDANQLESEYYQYCPPQPKVHPALMGFARDHKSFFQRYGQQAVQAADRAYYYLLNDRRRRPNTIKQKDIEDLLEMHGQTYGGVRFDPSERELNATQAAKISGVSAQTYNNAAQQLYNQRRLGKRAWL
jgi:hypothetical protein